MAAFVFKRVFQTVRALMMAAAGGLLFVVSGTATLAMLETTTFFIAPPLLATWDSSSRFCISRRGLFRTA